MKGAVSTQRLGSLVRVGRLAQTEINLEVLREEILAVVAEAMEAERATLYFLDTERRQLWSRAFTEAEVPEICVDLGRGIAGHVAQRGELVNVPDVLADPRFDPSTDRRTGYRTRSLLAAPLQGKSGEIIGVLQALNKRPEGAFDAADENLFALLATQVGTIVESSSLRRRPLTSRGRRTRDRQSERFNHIIGAGPAMREVYDRIDQVASTDVTVLIQGESGTGKGVISRAIHVNSARRNEPFVKVDCAALPETLIENELFGHEKGAFTGATGRTPGKLAQAGRGTLFIDEIGELPLAVQGKLLRVLQDREFEMLGGQKTQRVEARIIAATNRDLTAMVEEGRFREDLYYRIRVAVIALPALRERGPEDIRELAAFFVERMARRHGRPVTGLAPETEAFLARYPWPGNVRELEHCIESAVVFSEGGPLRPEHLALPRGARVTPQPSPRPALPVTAGDLLERELTLEELEGLYIRRVLERVEGNKSEAARRLGIGRNTLGRKLKRLGLG